MLLSIIIPYYNTLEYTKKLLDVLIPQLNDKVEVLLIDDGCNETKLNNYIYQDKFKEHWNSIHIWHLIGNSGGASKPRNIGLDNATGKYIAFIDSDDLISKDYIERITHKLNTDIIYLSWKMQTLEVLITDKPPKWNCAVWCRVYKRELIGNVRFDETLRVAEDWKFNEQLKPQTSRCIKKYVYYYNSGRKGSLING